MDVVVAWGRDVVEVTEGLLVVVPWSGFVGRVEGGAVAVVEE